MSKRFGGRAVFKAAVLATAASLASYAGGMVVSILVARVLGPGDYGHYAYVVWLSGLMVTLSASGFTNTAMRFISEYVGRAEPATSLGLHRRLRLQVLATVLAVCGVLAAAWPWLRPQGVQGHGTAMLLLVGLAFSTKAWFMYESAAAKGWGRFWVEAACLASLAVLNVLGVSALWLMSAKLEGYLLWFGLLSAAHLALVLVLTRKPAGAGVAPAPPDAELRGRVARHLHWGLLLGIVSVLASRSFETLLLNAHGGAEEVAYFSIAVMLTRSGVDLVAGGLSSVMVPVMSHGLGAGGNDRLRQVFVNVTRYYFFVGLILAGVGWFWAEPAVLLMYGERYRPVVLVLQVLVVGASLMMPSGALTALLSATENQKLRVAFTVLSVAFSAALAFALVPRWGLHGALVSVTASQWLVFIVTVALVDHWLGFRLPFAAMARLVALGALAAALAWLVMWAWSGPWGQLAAGLVFALAFVPATWASAVWTPSERDFARSYLAKLPVLRHWAGGRSA